MRRFTRLAGILSISAFGGCVPVDPPNQPRDLPHSGTTSRTDQTPLSPDESIAALRALEVFEVGGLILECGGNPNRYCVPNFKEEQEALAVDLASVATAAANNTVYPENACDDATIAANLAALRELAIVEIGELLVIQAENNPLCYNLPCPEDVDRAHKATCERAGKLANITDEVLEKM